jgi:hypothetical protein
MSNEAPPPLDLNNPDVPPEELPEKLEERLAYDTYFNESGMPFSDTDAASEQVARNAKQYPDTYTPHLMDHAYAQKNDFLTGVINERYENPPEEKFQWAVAAKEAAALNGPDYYKQLKEDTKDQGNQAAQPEAARAALEPAPPKLDKPYETNNPQDLPALSEIAVRRKLGKVGDKIARASGVDDNEILGDLVYRQLLQKAQSDAKKNGEKLKNPPDRNQISENAAEIFRTLPETAQAGIYDLIQGIHNKEKLDAANQLDQLLQRRPKYEDKSETWTIRQLADQYFEDQRSILPTQYDNAQKNLAQQGKTQQELDDTELASNRHDKGYKNRRTNFLVARHNFDEGDFAGAAAELRKNTDSSGEGAAEVLDALQFNDVKELKPPLLHRALGHVGLMNELHVRQGSEYSDVPYRDFAGFPQERLMKAIKKGDSETARSLLYTRASQLINLANERNIAQKASNAVWRARVEGDNDKAIDAAEFSLDIASTSDAWLHTMEEVIEVVPDLADGPAERERRANRLAGLQALDARFGSIEQNQQVMDDIMRTAWRTMEQASKEDARLFEQAEYYNFVKLHNLHNYLGALDAKLDGMDDTDPSKRVAVERRANVQKMYNAGLYKQQALRIGQGRGTPDGDNSDGLSGAHYLPDSQARAIELDDSGTRLYSDGSYSKLDEHGDRTPRLNPDGTAWIAPQPSQTPAESADAADQEITDNDLSNLDNINELDQTTDNALEEWFISQTPDQAARAMKYLQLRRENITQAAFADSANGHAEEADKKFTRANTDAYWEKYLQIASNEPNAHQAGQGGTLQLGKNGRILTDGYYYGQTGTWELRPDGSMLKLKDQNGKLLDQDPADSSAAYREYPPGGIPRGHNRTTPTTHRYSY